MIRGTFQKRVQSVNPLTGQTLAVNQSRYRDALCCLTGYIDDLGEKYKKPRSARSSSSTTNSNGIKSTAIAFIASQKMLTFLAEKRSINGPLKRPMMILGSCLAMAIVAVITAFPVRL